MMSGKIIFMCTNHFDGFIKEKGNQTYWSSNAWGIMRFLEENKYHNLARVKRFKTIFTFKSIV
jgi:hypothetical protein